MAKSHRQLLFTRGGIGVPKYDATAPVSGQFERSVVAGVYTVGRAGSNGAVLFARVSSDRDSARKRDASL